MEFWQELCQKSPSLTHLDTVGVEYERCVQGAERGFNTVLQLDPRSVGNLRGYAQFLIEVTNNPEKAEEFLTLADDIEDSTTSKQQAGEAAGRLVLMGKGEQSDRGREQVRSLTDVD
jgi:hypothetical protein